MQNDGGRGEWWVAVQIVMLGAIAVAPFVLPTGWPDRLHDLSRAAGVVIGAAGLILVMLAALFLGGSLTIFPRPKDDGQFTKRGVYGIVRHPMYGGVFLTCLGVGLFNLNLISFGLALALGLFFDRKAAREEIWLMEKYPDYAAYRQRVRKLIPWVY